MDLIYGFVFFIFGLIIGSFLNVCAYRIPRSESIAYPPSHCPSCGSDVRAIDNIPVLSYLLLSGRCRSCRERISPKYPVIELLTGLLWVASYYSLGLGMELPYALFFITTLILLSAIDFDTKTIPNKILLPAMALSVLLLLLYFAGLTTPPIVANMDATGAIIGFLAGGGFLYAVAMLAPLIFKKEAMGGGDIKLAAFMGLYLGGYVMLALFIGFFLGAVVGVILISRNKEGGQDMIPFGPFLAAGSIITLFFGPQMWHAYLSFSGLL
ncbi:MAG: prepilin peptidase [Candidatus Aquicultor sp.]|nr:prepilin peptidase [Candidatus Aquicultor sp.]